MNRTTDRLVRAEGCVWRRVGEDGVVVDMNGGAVFELGGAAVRIWELLEGEPTIDELLAALADEYEVEPETLKRDTERTIGELAASGLIRG